jgi:hypothetical protein
MQSNCDIKVTSLFKEKKNNNLKIRIILDSDSDDNQIIEVDKEPYKYNVKKENKLIGTDNDLTCREEIINLDESKENTKSTSQSSKSTLTSQSNTWSNSKNVSARVSSLKKMDKYGKKKEIKTSRSSDETNDMFNISSGTKKLLEKIKEKHKNAKKENKILLINNFCKINENKEEKKLIGKKIKNVDESKEIKNKIEPIKLSEKTQEVIKNIKKYRTNKFLNENKDNISNQNYCRMSSFSNLHVKYSELLQPSRELRLPLIYKKLYEFFMILEKTINRNKLSNKNNLNTFNNIKEIIRNYSKLNFNVNILKQILYIVPHFYILKYTNNNKNQSTFSLSTNIDKNYDLLIDIPSDFNERMQKDYPKDFDFLSINYYSENGKFEPIMRGLTENEMKQRNQIFQNILNCIVSEYHIKFLKENNILIKFNPLKQKIWHHEFDPDKYCLPIPFFEFPSPPEYKSIFVETITKNDIKTQLSSIKYEETLIKHDSNGSLQSSASKFVSEEYIKKIRAKEQASNIVREINQFNYYYNLKKDRNKMIKEMLMQIKTLLMTHKGSLGLNELSELILNSNREFKDFFVNVLNLNKIIINFTKQYSGFIKVSNHSRLGFIVVLLNNEYIIPDNFNNLE